MTQTLYDMKVKWGLLFKEKLKERNTEEYVKQITDAEDMGCSSYKEMQKLEWGAVNKQTQGLITNKLYQNDPYTNCMVTYQPSYMLMFIDQATCFSFL